MNSAASTELRTRLREYRKARGWTLAHVAQEIGTTAQTISRLETNTMTVSTDWLQKFAELFGVTPAELIAEAPTARTPVIGHIRADGLVVEADLAPLAHVVHSDEAFAARLDAAIGPYREGGYLVAEKLSGRNNANAFGQHCVCKTSDGQMRIAIPAQSDGETVTLVPLEGGSVLYDQQVEWLAQIRMEVRVVT